MRPTVESKIRALSSRRGWRRPQFGVRRRSSIGRARRPKWRRCSFPAIWRGGGRSKIRVACGWPDVNVAPDGPVTLLLSTKRDHVLRGGDVEISLPSTMASALDATRLAQREKPSSTRGVEDAFRRGLFAVAFGRAYFDGFTAATPSDPYPALVARADDRDRTPTRKWIGGGLVVLSVAAIATGIVYGVMAQDDAEQYRDGVGLADDLVSVRQRAEERQTISNVLIGSGVAAALGGAALWVW